MNKLYAHFLKMKSFEIITLFLFSALRIHCSCQCKKMLDELGGYQLEERGLVSMKVCNRVLTTNLAMQLIAVDGN